MIIRPEELRLLRTYENGPRTWDKYSAIVRSLREKHLIQTADGESFGLTPKGHRVLGAEKNRPIAASCSETAKPVEQPGVKSQPSGRSHFSADSRNDRERGEIKMAMLIKEAVPEMKFADGTEAESAHARAARLAAGMPGASAEDIARLLLKELLHENQGTVIEVLLPWISDRVRAVMRTAARHAERTAWGEETRQDRKATAVRTQTGKLPATDSIQEFLNATVLVPGRSSPVAWKDLTVEDHKARIALLRRTVDGTQRTIGRHEWAIREIQKNKVETLAGIPAAKLSKDIEL